jgi:sugar-specific transcriptional regulator TrmB
MADTADVKRNLYSSLKELGLTDLEADLYVTSLAVGPSPLATLAKQMGMSRPNIYKVIAGLEQRGLVAISKRKKYARTFVVEPPTMVLEKLREKRGAIADLDQTVASALPDLMALYHQGETPTKIKVLEGAEQWLKIFFQILDEAKDSIDFFGSADEFIGLITWEKEREWIKKRMEKGIRLNALLLPGKDAEALKAAESKEMRTTRFFRGTVPFVTGFMLYANKVVIWQPRAPLVVSIEDEFIVAMLKSMFMHSWAMSA